MAALPVAEPPATSDVGMVASPSQTNRFSRFTLNRLVASGESFSTMRATSVTETSRPVARPATSSPSRTTPLPSDPWPSAALRARTSSNPRVSNQASTISLASASLALQRVRKASSRRLDAEVDSPSPPSSGASHVARTSAAVFASSSP